MSLEIVLCFVTFQKWSLSMRLATRDRWKPVKQLLSSFYVNCWQHDVQLSMPDARCEVPNFKCDFTWKPEPEPRNPCHMWHVTHTLHILPLQQSSSSFIVIQEQEARVKIITSIINLLKMYHLNHSFNTYIYLHDTKCVESRVMNK